VREELEAFSQAGATTAADVGALLALAATPYTDGMQASAFKLLLPDPERSVAKLGRFLTLDSGSGAFKYNNVALHVVAGKCGDQLLLRQQAAEAAAEAAKWFWQRK
jgi:hypothetical protein